MTAVSTTPPASCPKILGSEVWSGMGREAVKQRHDASGTGPGLGNEAEVHGEVTKAPIGRAGQGFCSEVPKGSEVPMDAMSTTILPEEEDEVTTMNWKQLSKDGAALVQVPISAQPAGAPPVQAPTANDWNMVANSTVKYMLEDAVHQVAASYVAMLWCPLLPWSLP